MVMKDKDIKKVFDQIKTDEETKSRILENVYREVEDNNKRETNGIGLIYLKNKRVISTLAASLILVCGVFLFNNSPNENNLNMPSANPTVDENNSNSPLVNENEKLDIEFNNFNIDSLKNKTTTVEIINNNDYTLIKEVEDTEVIELIFKNIEDAKALTIKQDNATTKEEKEDADKFFENINNSQLKGNSMAIRFVTKNNTSGAIRMYLDLNIICINGSYYEVSEDMVKLIENVLK